MVYRLPLRLEPRSHLDDSRNHRGLLRVRICIVIACFLEGVLRSRCSGDLEPSVFLGILECSYLYFLERAEILASRKFGFDLQDEQGQLDLVFAGEQDQ